MQEQQSACSIHAYNYRRIPEMPAGMCGFNERRFGKLPPFSNVLAAIATIKASTASLNKTSAAVVPKIIVVKIVIVSSPS